MLALLIALLAPPTANPLQVRCLDAGHAPSCDRWLLPMGVSAPEADLRRACAFEAPYSCGLLADRRPRWASADQRVEWRMIACRASDGACSTLAAELDDAGVSTATSARAQRAVERACARWPGVCLAVARAAQTPAARARALTRGCDGRDARACRELAWRLEQGDGVPKDPQRARVAGDKACKLGSSDLCLHRLRQRQAAQDWAGIRRMCRRGDTLSCSAHDARGCLRGDAAACQRAAVVPRGACPLKPLRCEEIRSALPGGGGGGCVPQDECAQARQNQRSSAYRWLTKAAQTCAVTRARIRLHVGRSGDLFKIQVAPPPSACFLSQIKAMQLPPVATPSLIWGHVVDQNGTARVRLRVTGERGAPRPRSPLEQTGRWPK